MSAAVSTDGILLLSGWLLAAAAITLLLLALFRDRARGRRRCPGCWYDMSGVPGLTCPECGRAARSERRLLRTRRHWRRAAAAMPVFLLAGAVGSIPAYRAGWPAVVPSTILIFVAPVDAPSLPATAPAGNVIRFPPNWPANATPAQPPPPSVRDLLRTEAWTRLHRGRMARWQSQFFLGRFLRSASVDPESLVALPSAWVVGEPIPVRYAAPAAGTLTGLATELRLRESGDAWILVDTGQGRPGTHRLPAPPSGSQRVTLDLRLRGQSGPVYSASFTLPIRIRPPPLLDPVATGEADQLVQRTMDLRLRRTQDGGIVLARAGGMDGSAAAELFGVEFRAAILVGEEVVGRAVGCAGWGDPSGAYPWESHINFVPGGRERLELALAGDPGRVRIAVAGAMDRALIAYMEDPFNKPRAAAWAGGFEIPAVLGATFPG